MADRGYRYSTTRPRSPSLHNPARASLPTNVGESTLHVVPTSRRSGNLVSNGGTITTTYKVTTEPPARSSSNVRGGSRQRRSTVDSHNRPDISTTVNTNAAPSHRPVIHTTVVRPASPVKNPYRSSEEDYSPVLVSSSARHPHRHHKRYSTALDGADIGRLAHERDSSRLRVAPAREAHYATTRSRPSRSSSIVRHADTVADDYGDDGYGYTNPRDLVQYDLDNTPAPRRARRDSFENGRNARPTSISSYQDLSGRSYDPRERGPPPSTRGFKQFRAPVWDQHPVRVPPPVTAAAVDAVARPPPYDAGDLPKRRNSITRAAPYNAEPRRNRSRSVDRREDYYDDRDGPRRVPRYDRDEGVESRGFGIRTEAPRPVTRAGDDARKHVDDVRPNTSSGKIRRAVDDVRPSTRGHEARRVAEDIRPTTRAGPRRANDSRRDEARRHDSSSFEESTRGDEYPRSEDSRRAEASRRDDEQRRSERSERGERSERSERSDRYDDDYSEPKEHKESKTRDALTAGLSLAGAALGIGALKNVSKDKDDREEDRDSRDGKEDRRRRDYDDESRRHRVRDEEAVDLSGRDPKERRHRDEVPSSARDVPPPSQDISSEKERKERSPPDTPIVDLSGRDPKERSNPKDERNHDKERHHRRHRSNGVNDDASDSRSVSSGSASDDVQRNEGRQHRERAAGAAAFNPKDPLDLRALQEALKSKDAAPKPVAKEPTPKARESNVRTSHEAAEIRRVLDDEKRSRDTQTTGGTETRVVSPPREKADEKPVKGILRQPREKFPEDPAPIREGVAPLKDAKKDGIPPDARWTKISRRLVNPKALEAGKERFEAREDFVIVLRVLSKEEVQGYAEVTEKIRATREELEELEASQARRRARRERHERHKREKASGERSEHSGRRRHSRRERDSNGI